MTSALSHLPTPAVHYLAVAPTLVLMGGAVLLLFIAALTRRRLPVWVSTTVTTVTTVVSFALAFVQWHDVATRGARTTIAHALVLDGFAVVSGAVISLGVFLSTFVVHDWARRARLLGGEFHMLLLASASGAMIMTQANDLIVLFLGLEILSIGLYVLVAYDRHRTSSGEASLKYLLLGGFASALFVYGAALTYGGTGSTNLSSIAYFLSKNYLLHPGVVVAGVALLLVGFAFKVAVVPFHSWSPDVYEGAPAPVTGFMATVVKVGAFVAVLRVLDIAFATQAQSWRPIVAAFIVLSTLVGSTVAISQRSSKRLMAYSSINQAGFMMLGLWSATPRGVEGTLFYVMTYLPVVIAIFAVITVVGGANEDQNDLSVLRGLARRQPWLGIPLAILLLAQAGAPFTTGFFSKFTVLVAAISAHGTALAVLVMLTAAVAAFVYLRVVLSLFSESEPSVSLVRVPRLTTFVVVGSAAATIVFGVWPSLLADLAHHAATILP